MEEAKKKYLDDLRKQIDPKILEKMSQHLGGDEGGAIAAASGEGSSSGASSVSNGSSASTPADKIRERKASEFQRRVAERKSQDMLRPDSKKDEPRRTLVIYSHTEFWTRIAESQFKNLGFQEVASYYDFEQLVRAVFGLIGSGEQNIMLAVSILRISKFLTSWNKLQEQMAAQGKPDVFSKIQYMLAVESMKQVPEKIIPVIGHERIIDLTAENFANREKIGSLANRVTKADADTAE